ncbi:hypothetical protein EJB05_24956 [Eragrostis curvula]|uniref:Uncharacterized protein n=1 Tax=Eragrostis curvula TaxID=38414 RepID=A0A5J9VE71_9POAL|nr:hypothetical protein EJB05_24956 [Eragrostis curvula]
MALEWLDKARTATKVFCAIVCIWALVMLATNVHLLRDTMTGVSLVALIVQSVLIFAQLVGPRCFGAAGPLPNSLRSSLVVVLLDFLVASFLTVAGLGCVGIANQKMYNHVCFSRCWISFHYSLVVILGGVLAYIATMLNMLVACKMNLERNHQN